MTKRTGIMFLELDKSIYDSSPVLHPYVEAILSDISDDAELIFSDGQLESMDLIFIVSDTIDDLKLELQEIIKKRGIVIMNILEAA